MGVKVKKSITLPKLANRAQIAFNSWIRNRDKDNGCICCGGLVQHAGHYLSQGHHGAHRFDENNVHGCCIKCNVYLHGNLIEYRIGLIDKIGLKAVEELESRRNEVRKWQRSELEEIIKTYKI